MNKKEKLPITKEHFCKLHTAYHGELIDNIKQLTFQNFTGEELYEFCNFIAKEILQNKIYDNSFQEEFISFSEILQKNIEE